MSMMILGLAALAVLILGGVMAAVFLMNRSNRNDDTTHGGGFSDSGPASFGD